MVWCLGTFTAMVWVQSSVRKVRSLKLCGAAKKKKKKRTKIHDMKVLITSFYSNLSLSCICPSVPTLLPTSGLFQLLNDANAYVEFFLPCLLLWNSHSHPMN